MVSMMSAPIRPEVGFNDPQSYAPRRRTSPGSLPFEGDVAIQALRRWLAREPAGVLPPPNWRNRLPAAEWTGTLSFICVLTAIAVLIAAIIIFPDAVRKNTDGVADLRPSLLEGMSRTAPSARLQVKSQKGFVNDPLPLGVSIKDASGGETVTLTGLAAGSNVSAATPSEQTRSTPQAMQADIITLINHAEAMLEHGDIASARLLLRRAANAGSAQAAFTLGGTFDPVFLAEKGVLGFAPDAAQASAWYQRAMELGSTEASRRLERLATMGR